MALSGGIVAIAFMSGVYLLWYFHRSQPDAIQDQVLFDGITYTRDVRQDPRPLVIHVASIDLTNPSVEFLVTPRDDIDGFDYAARTVSEFVSAFDVQLAINGDFFSPWYSYTPLHYYPHRGDGVNVRGPTANDGTLISEGYDLYNLSTLSISEQNTVKIGAEREPTYHAISGNHILVRQSNVIPDPINAHPYFVDPHPRTAVGITADGTTLLFIVVDGRQPNYSEGVSIQELGQIAYEYGAYDALNLDGGGSTTMVTQTEDGKPRVLNSPIHSRMPGRERPVANHLGVYLQSASNTE